MLYVNIEKVIDILSENEILDNVSNYYKLSGGTSSELWLIEDNINRKIVVKFNSKDTIKYESLFLNEYRDLEMFPKVIYLDNEFEFLVYEYMSGETSNVELNKSLLKQLINLVSGYKVYVGNGYGWIDEPTKWKEFLLSRVNESKVIIEEYNLKIDTSEIIKSIEKVSLYKFGKYLLHGDLGVHNFISEKGRLTGIIDPIPVIGDKIYDILYAICSKPKFLAAIEINDLNEELFCLGYSDEIINCYLKIILYVRIGSCIKYHSEDLNLYLKLYSRYIRK